jgi:hypothetical protein
VAWQQRRVDVQDPVRRYVEEDLRNDLAIVGEDREVRPEVSDRFDGVLGADPRRLEDRKPALVSRHRDRRTVDRLASPSRPVRGSHDGDDLDPRNVLESVEGRNGESTRSQEHDPRRRAGHARAFAASSSASSSSPLPTGISSSIESR